MKILNLIWGFTLGAGIDKCFLTYARLGEVDNNMHIKSVCVNITNLDSHIEPLKEIGVSFIDIKNRYDFSWLKKIKKCIAIEKPDIVFTHGFNGAIIMMMERLFMSVKTPFICSYHGAYHAPSISKRIFEPIYNGLSLLIYKHLAKRVICVENVSRDYLIKKGVDVKKVYTVHNGISDITSIKPIDLKQIISYNDSPTIITASRITTVKGLPFLLEALALLKANGISFRYVMIGEGPDLENLRIQSTKLGLNEDISFVGFQSNVADWLADCDIFALPSLYEYHSIAVLEAMRAGKAIVATTVGGNGESITDGVEGLLVPPSDPVALADALEKLLSDSELRKRLGQNARNRFEREFTETAMMKGLVNVFKSVSSNES